MQIDHWVDNKITPFGVWALISISDEETGRGLAPLRFLGCRKLLAERFHDITMESRVVLDELTDSKGRPIELFNETKAKRIVQFIDDINSRDIETLVVNCAAGVSRSGAVSLFACRYLKLDEKMFREENKYIHPNSSY